MSSKFNIGHRFKKDNSIYMGVSPTTGTDFYLHLDLPKEFVCPPEKGLLQQRPVCKPFDTTTAILREAFSENREFLNHSFSKHQLEDEIVESYKNGTADGGLRRLTKDEWEQVNKVFEEKPRVQELFEKRFLELNNIYLKKKEIGSLGLYDKFHGATEYFQSASITTEKQGTAYYEDLRNKSIDDRFYRTWKWETGIILGRSETATRSAKNKVTNTL